MGTLTKTPDTVSNTHEVFNQPAELGPYNLFSSDAVLSEAVAREGAEWALPRLEELGDIVGSEEVRDWGNKANQFTPELHTHDRFGNRIDRVEFHPSYHELMSLSVRYRVHNLPWSETRPGAHVARAAMMMLVSQNEAGHGCPISMTYSVVPALKNQNDLAELWLPLLLSDTYDRRFLPASEKNGVLMGMGMTEKQGGSDVKANTTIAKPEAAGGPGKPYLLTGHKWFCSAPMCDAFLILAQAPGGLSCFLMPRWTPDGRLNNFFIQRLKNKLGNRSNASSEVEFQNAFAWLVGEEGRGVPTIIEMVTHTRLDCVLSSAALMRQALVQACHHSFNRKVFGKLIVEQELMQQVLADLAIESEAATMLAMRLAGSFDRAVSDGSEEGFRRIATAVAKYWVCKRAPQFVYECLECLGGSGYVEESIMPRIYRESPLNSIWEGSGNVICLDVLRAIKKEPRSIEVFLEEVNKAKGSSKKLDDLVSKIEVMVSSPSQTGARSLVESMALALQGSLMLRFAPDNVAREFVNSKLAENRGLTYGSGRTAIGDSRSIIGRAWPA